MSAFDPKRTSGGAGRANRACWLEWSAYWPELTSQADQFGLTSAKFFCNADAERMPKENNGLEFEGLNAPTLFREFAAECMELAQVNPEKRALHLKMASVWHQMAQRWEKKS